MIKKLLFTLFFIPAIAYAQFDRPGSTDAQFLKIGVSPRGTALSDAYIAVVEGAEAAYYNASALAWIQGTDVVFNHNFWFAGINHDFAAVGHNFGNIGTFAVSATALYTDEMKVRTPLQPEGTGETFYAGNYRIGLSYSRFFTDRVSVGATLSWINLSLFPGFSADAVSVDISTMYVSDFRGFRFAMSITNFGSNIQFVNESYPLPTHFTFGAGINAVDAEQQKLLVTFSASKPNDGQPIAQAGMEWNYQDMFFARGGYRFNHEVASYSFGAGFHLNVSGFQTRVDYSYAKYNLLGASHRIGLGIAFD